MAEYVEKAKNDVYYYEDEPRRQTSYALADVGTRAIALLVDGMILGMIGGLSSMSSRPMFGFAVGFLISLGYQWFFMTRFNGQTPGKMLMGIRVVKANGEALTGTDAVVCYIGYYVNSLPFTIGLGWLWAIFDHKHQGWHDKMAQTYVVKR